MTSLLTQVPDIIQNVNVCLSKIEIIIVYKFLPCTYRLLIVSERCRLLACWCCYCWCTVCVITHKHTSLERKILFCNSAWALFQSFRFCRFAFQVFICIRFCMYVSLFHWDECDEVLVFLKVSFRAKMPNDQIYSHHFCD